MLTPLGRLDPVLDDDDDCEDAHDTSPDVSEPVAFCYGFTNTNCLRLHNRHSQQYSSAAAAVGAARPAADNCRVHDRHESLFCVDVN